MPSPIEQALISLVPTFNALPSELISLATSLLAQSRANAASLKPEEEIGRIYACAHIACERQKQRFNLEKLVPRPPCPPRIYKKLYTYLDKALVLPTTPRTPRHRDALARQAATSGTAGSANATPRSLRRPQNTPGTPGTPSKTPVPALQTDTPSKRAEKRLFEAQSVPRPETTTSARKRRKVGNHAAVTEHEHMPAFVQPMIHALCVSFAAPTAAGPIFAGLTTALASRGYEDGDADTDAATDAMDIDSTPRTRGQTSASTPSRTPRSIISTVATAAMRRGPLTPARLPALLIVLALFVTARLSDTDVSETGFVMQRARGIEAVRSLPEGFAQGDEELVMDVQHFMAAAVDEGWLGSWYEDVPLGGGGSGIGNGNNGDADGQDALPRAEEGEDEDVDEDGDADAAGGRRQAKTPLRRKEKHAVRDDAWVCAAGLEAGLGTMFQDAVDWLSDDRRAEYKVWYNQIRAQCQRIEREDGRRSGAVLAV